MFPDHLWLIPALPLLAAGIGAVTPRRGRAVSAAAAIAAIAAAFLLSCWACHVALDLVRSAPDPMLHDLLGMSAPEAHSNFAWFDLGRGALRLGWLLDPLTAFMCVMVTFVGLLIFIFSLGYMRADPNFTGFFCFLSLFAAAMLGVVIANSLLLLFVCWELVGLASYLLIGFWFHKPEAAAAAKKAFITTRIGDLGFLLGILWLHHTTGTLLFYDGGAGLLEHGPAQQLLYSVAGPMIASTAISLLIFCGAVGKSGQFPLHVWLPDAMEGPTPVSALIHAATMVAAGVFLVARVYGLMSLDLSVTLVSGHAPLHALTVVAFIGAITALIGAGIAVAQNDIKRILAFSTVSQLGYMMLALGVGSWVAAIFHLLTHAFFKSLLFLGAGSIIDSAHHEQDIRRLGGLGRRMRVTFATFAVGMMALSGVPFFFSGFWSKESILHAAQGWSVSSLPFFAALLGVVVTAFYMTRLMAEVFFGEPRSESAAHARESSLVMTLPLVFLALGAIGLGFLGTPAWPWLQARLDGSAVTASFLFQPRLLREGAGLMSLSIFLVALGLGCGGALYLRRPRTRAGAPDPLAAALPRLFAFLAARMKFDEFYAATFGRLSSWLAAFAAGLDRWVWGGGVNFLAQFGEFSGFLDRDADEDGLNAGFDAASERLRGAGQAYSRRQTGGVQGYLRALAIAFAVLALLAILGAGP